MATPGKSTNEGTKPTKPSKGGKGSSSVETRQRIIDATVDSLNSEGMMGTTARSIARSGGFNQALIYYHFDSLEGLFFEVIKYVNDRRLAHFGPRLEQVATLGELVEVAIELHQGVPDARDNSAVALLVAGWSTGSGLGPKVLETLRPWDDAVSSAVERIMSESSLPALVPVDELAYAISALFLGLQLLSRLDPKDKTATQVFDSLAGGANAATTLLTTFSKPKPA